MSRFLDQIRKAKESREKKEAADKGSAQGDASSLSEEELEGLFPDELTEEDSNPSGSEVLEDLTDLPEETPAPAEELEAEEDGGLFPSDEEMEKLSQAEGEDFTDWESAFDEEGEVDAESLPDMSAPEAEEVAETAPEELTAEEETGEMFEQSEAPGEEEDLQEGGDWEKAFEAMENAGEEEAEPEPFAEDAEMEEPSEEADMEEVLVKAEGVPAAAETVASSATETAPPHRKKRKKKSHGQSWVFEEEVEGAAAGPQKTSPRPERKGTKPKREAVPLFPSELEDKDESASAPARPSRSRSRGSVLFQPETAGFTGRQKAAPIRGEIPVPGPEVNPEFVRRISLVDPKPNREVVTFYDPRHHICEEYRLLGKNLLHTFANTGETLRKGKVIVLTSSVRNEGKTLTSLNLALTLAQDLKDRVLLVDGDLRHPKIHRYGGFPPSTGLNDLATSDDPESILEDCIQRTEMGLHLLLAQATRGNPAPLLDNPRMTKTLEVLRNHYSVIIVDTPPVLLATDSLTMGARSDGMLFLLRARKTQREQIQEARQRIARLEIRLLGYVINNVKSFLPRIWSRYYYGDY